MGILVPQPPQETLQSSIVECEYCHSHNDLEKTGLKCASCGATLPVREVRHVGGGRVIAKDYYATKIIVNPDPPFP